MRITSRSAKWAFFVITLCGATNLALAQAGSNAPNTASELHQRILDKEWVLKSFKSENGSVSPLKEITIKFEKGGQAGGSGGCNSYGGAYTLDGNKLVMREIMSTMRACIEETAMNQEAAYFAALGKAHRIEVDKNQLIIHYDQGKSLQFTQSNRKPNSNVSGHASSAPTSCAGRTGTLVMLRPLIRSRGEIRVTAYHTHQSVPAKPQCLDLYEPDQPGA